MDGDPPDTGGSPAPSQVATEGPPGTPPDVSPGEEVGSAFPTPSTSRSDETGPATHAPVSSRSSEEGPAFPTSVSPSGRSEAGSAFPTSSPTSQSLTESISASPTLTKTDWSQEVDKMAPAPAQKTGSPIKNPEKPGKLAIETDTTESMDEEAHKLFYSLEMNKQTQATKSSTGRPTVISNVTKRAEQKESSASESTDVIMTSVSGSSLPPPTPRVEAARRGDLPRRGRFTPSHAERMLLTLWPSPEHKAEFKRCTGCDLDPARYFADLEFRDSYLNFLSARHPRAEVRTFLRKRAQILANKSAVGKAFLATQKREFDQKHGRRGEESASHRTPSMKRTREPSISPASGSQAPHRQGPQGKTSRPSTSPSSSGSLTPTRRPVTDRPSPPPITPTPTPPSTEVNEEEEMDDDAAGTVDEDAPRVSHFTADMRDALPQTAAEVVKGVEYPHALFVYEGREERRRMSKKTWDLLAVKIQDATLDAILAGHNLQVAGLRVHYGRGCVLCENRETAMKMKELVGGLKVAETTFRAWAKDEVGEWSECTLRLPPSMPASKIAAVKIMQVCALMNRWPQDSYRIRDFKPAPGSTKDSILRFGANTQLVEVIRASKGAVKIGCSKVNVHHKGQLLTNE